MTGVLFPVSGSVESAGCRFFCWDGEGDARGRWNRSGGGWSCGMLLRFCRVDVDEGTPEEGGIGPGRDSVGGYY